MTDDNELVLAEQNAEKAAELLADGSEAAGNRNILELPVRIRVSIGEAQITVQSLLDLTKDSIIDLESMVEDAVDIFVGERLIARGELVEAKEDPNGIGVKIIEVCGVGE
ncbi:MAG: FliM/FliN family flagellar motor switch protein [Parvularculaceae bacterium]